MAGILTPRKPTGGLLGAVPLPPPGLLGGGLPGDDLWRLQAYRQKMMADALANTWPAQMAKSAWGAFTLPGDVYAGKVDPLSDEGVQRSADLAGFVTLGAGAIPAEANSARAGIKVYHGSPHDFDKFELSDKTIGTGEGAQAYGHGLYFAENEGVARGYRDGLSPGKVLGKDGRPPMGDPWADIAAATHRVAGGDWERANQVSDEVYQGLMNGDDIEDFRKFVARSDWDAADKRLYDAALDAASEFKFVKSPGRVYEAELNASPDDFLDWDKPLSEQPKVVQDAYVAAMREFGNEVPESVIRGQNIPGSAIYGDIASQAVGKTKGDAVAATNALRAAGIKGIRYKDAGSRTKEGGTSNYVVFDDNIINILRKYGIAGLIGGAAGVGAMAAQPGTAEARESR